MVGMMLVVTLLSVLVGAASGVRTTPVLVLDGGLLAGAGGGAGGGPLQLTAPAQFSRLLDTVEARAPTVIVFVEPTLSVEDFTLLKDANGSPFKHIRDAFLHNNLRIFYGVENPLRTLVSRWAPTAAGSLHVRGRVPPAVPSPAPPRLYVFLDRPALNETRLHALRRHDQLMEQVISYVKKVTIGGVIAIYTGTSSAAQLLLLEEEGVVAHGESGDAPAPALAPAATASDRFQQLECEYALLQFKDCKLVNGESIPLEPTGCVRGVHPERGGARGGKNAGRRGRGWSYTVTLKPRPTKEIKETAQYLLDSFYELKFDFTYRDPEHKRLGWKLIEVSYWSASAGELSAAPAQAVGEWDVQHSGDTLHMRPAMDLVPALHVTQYTILLYSNKHDVLESLKMRTGDEEPGKDKQQDEEGKKEKDAESRGREDEEGRRRDDEETRRQDDEETDEAEMRAKTGVARQDKEILVSVGIVTGLLVVAIQVCVLFMGVGMLLGVRSNDHFDATDSKPLYNPDAVND